MLVIYNLIVFILNRSMSIHFLIRELMIYGLESHGYLKLPTYFLYE